MINNLKSHVSYLFPLMKNVEILAPVGSFESLAAAVQAGANAVYFGVEQLNMRARAANNFTLEDMVTVVNTCKANGIKAYLTLNTILYDHDIQLMRRLVRKAKDAGIDAVIASDFAVMHEAKTIGLPVHISTQANVSNVETVEFFAPFADVVVLARELSLKQVAAITREIKRKNIVGPSGNLIRIEIFAHGALCMAVSGKCYLSLHTHFASANRGACIQNCRRSYIVTDKEEGMEFEIDDEYIMSAKDLCTIDFLDEVLEAGVSVLKIEGRGRSADYVFTTVQCYKEAVAAINGKTYTPDHIIKWRTELARVYNRGFWDGYYLGRKLGEWSNQYGSVATEKKVYVGKGSNYFKKIGIAEFTLEAGNLKKDDELMVISPVHGVFRYSLNQMVVNGEESAEAMKGDKITFPFQNKVTSNDKLYKVIAD